ncbi:premelanosome protein a isoform X2 [Hippocampus comes]|uniref:premelanosome protein a isoform X1 n=2 Tax=Hippocampus comes TaxID=109280 RepID=UPI00094E0B52|nr:PREDICTED: melanocyte protein PMEL isoform X1 [Hippocampus comes]XP_019737014.1 PREDICTED: melanocyte protein PMEL isoform X2 [Hippocampus comes]
MKTLVLLLLMALALTSTTAQMPRSQFTRYRSWNSRMYPVWKDGDPRFRNCWSGGAVTFDLKNDAPTLLGAKSTFSINLVFPPNQTVLANGQVVWAHNCTIDGQEYQAGQAVYPDQSNEFTGVFPDGMPFTRTRDRKPRYVYVWKTWGKYWQVADGPSSSLTISTDDVSLGSYSMEVIIYHCRGKNKFIPLGYASTVFTITDQVPFTVSLAQVNDINQDDSNFIQNRAIAFSVNLHDPSQYLSSADITFSWDFGDSTGTLISRERTVTHTYLAVGTFKPQVVLMASIPIGCVNPSAGVPVAPAIPAVVVTPAADPALAADVPAPDTDPAAAADAPVPDATPVEASVQPAAAATNTDDTDAAIDGGADELEAVSAAPAPIDAAVAPAEQDPAATPAPAPEVDVVAEDADASELATAASLQPEAEDTTEVETAAVDEAAENVPEVAADATVAPVAEGEEIAVDVAATVLPEAVVTEVTIAAEEEVAAAAEDVAEVVQTETAPAEDVVVAAATESTTAEEAEAADAEAEITETDNDVATVAPEAGDEEVLTEGEVQAEVETDPAQIALVVVKRQAPEVSANCMVYRYGSLATSVDVVQGIESVEIVQMSNVVSLSTELAQNAVDITVSCQGSLPSEVCTVISDADCITPVDTVCSAAAPSPDCQMVLRQFFNDSGVFCLNVSLTNDVSLAMASARVSVALASGGSPAGTAAIILGVMVIACVVCCIGLMYRRFKQYQPMTEDNNGGSSAVTSVPLLLWNLLMRQSPGESRPLLQGRIV